MLEMKKVEILAQIRYYQVRGLGWNRGQSPTTSGLLILLSTAQFDIQTYK